MFKKHIIILGILIETIINWCPQIIFNYKIIHNKLIYKYDNY